MSGKLYLVPTPIGNLKDITLRALEILKDVDLVAAEDTRQSLKLLNHYEIKKPLFSYHQHNENSKSIEIIKKLEEGINIALVTDAGSPGISDPGSVVVKACIENNIKFEVLPGATAFTTALIYSGIDTTKFVFRGFIGKENKDKRKVIDEIKNFRETIIFYEAPHRLIETLKFLNSNLGNRKIAVCRELTKLHEEIFRGTLEESIEYFLNVRPRGEFVLVIEGKSDEEIREEQISQWKDLTIREHLEKVINDGMDKKSAIKFVAKERNLSKNEVYKEAIDM